MANSQMEDAIFVLAGHVFLKTSDYVLCLDALARLFGPSLLQYLLLFLAFVRAAHYWTETHPEIAFEDDINQLLATHEALADCILNDRLKEKTGHQTVEGAGLDCDFDTQAIGESNLFNGEIVLYNLQFLR